MEQALWREGWLTPSHNWSHQSPSGQPVPHPGHGLFPGTRSRLCSDHWNANGFRPGPRVTKSHTALKGRAWKKNLKFLALSTVSKTNNSYASKTVIWSEFPNLRKENVKVWGFPANQIRDPVSLGWCVCPCRTAVMEGRQLGHCLMDIFPEMKVPLFRRPPLCHASPGNSAHVAASAANTAPRCTQPPQPVSFAVWIKARECTARWSKPLTVVWNQSKCSLFIWISQSSANVIPEHAWETFSTMCCLAFWFVFVWVLVCFRLFVGIFPVFGGRADKQVT